MPSKKVAKKQYKYIVLNDDYAFEADFFCPSDAEAIKQLSTMKFDSGQFFTLTKALAEVSFTKADVKVL